MNGVNLFGRCENCTDAITAVNMSIADNVFKRIRCYSYRTSYPTVVGLACAWAYRTGKIIFQCWSSLFTMFDGYRILSSYASPFWAMKV